MFADHKNETDASMVFGAIAGMDLPVFRIEAEYDYFDAKDFNTNAALANIYAKIPSTIILPYIGAGIGMVFGGDQTFTNSGIETKYKSDTQNVKRAKALLVGVDILLNERIVEFANKHTRLQREFFFRKLLDIFLGHLSMDIFSTLGHLSIGWDVSICDRKQELLSTVDFYLVVRIVEGCIA